MKQKINKHVLRESQICENARIFSSIANTIADSYLGLDDYAWIDKMVAWSNEDKNEGDSVTINTWKQVELAKKSKVKNENFIGTYTDSWFGDVEVFEKNKQLWIKCNRSPKLNGPMAFYNATTFAIKWEYQAMNCDACSLGLFLVCLKLPIPYL